MPGVIVIGGQWGDEGKGKIIDTLSRRADVIVRFQGGDNAGHTVVVSGKKYVFHLIPSGIIWPEKQCLIGHGVVVNPFSLLDERRMVEENGCKVEGRLWVSDRAHLILPYHMQLDGLSERHLGDGKIGTTNKGIGPTYSDKCARSGIRMGDLLDVDYLRERVKQSVSIKNRTMRAWGETDEIDAEELIGQLMQCREELIPLITDTVERLHCALDQGQSVLWEGAQGTLLDIDLGTYPFVTSSNTCVGGALTGSGVGPKAIDQVVAVVKAYTTRVGGGPFPTQCAEEAGQFIREKGHEYGATTGRPRRCGWFDVMAVRYAMEVNGVDCIALTKLDVLDEHERIKVCTGYKYRGESLSRFPSDINKLSSCEPIYEELDGWQQDTIGVQHYEDLPQKARDYLEILEEKVGVPMALVSTGPARKDIIEKTDLFQGA